MNTSPAYRHPIDPLLRGAIIERYARVCQYCGAHSASLYVGPGDRPWHIDHKVPVFHGGSDTEDNLTLACAACNVKKRAAMPGEDWQQRPLRRERSAESKRRLAVRLLSRFPMWFGGAFPFVSLGTLSEASYIRVSDLRMFAKTAGLTIHTRDYRKECLSQHDTVCALAHFCGLTVTDLETGGITTSEQ